MKKALILLIELLSTIFLFANADIHKDFIYPENVSKNGKYKIVYDSDTKSSSCIEASSSAKIWEIEANAQKFYISDDGVYLITLNETVKGKIVNDIRQEIGFSVYKNGQLCSEKPIEQILSKVYMAKRSIGASYYWGKIEQIYEKGFILNTVEGLKLFDFDTMDFPNLDIPDIYTPWQENELIDYTMRQISKQIYECYNFMITIDTDNVINNHISLSYHGKYDGGVYAPAEYWSITKDGYLQIYDDIKYKKTLKKLCLDQENELAYVVKNGKIFKYEYYTRTW